MVIKTDQKGEQKLKLENESKIGLPHDMLWHMGVRSDLRLLAKIESLDQHNFIKDLVL